jgi:hypothetical protein
MTNQTDVEALPTDLRDELANDKDADLEKAVQLASADPKLLDELLRGILSKQDTYRYNCFQVLLQISEQEPAILYPRWDYLVEQLDSDNSYHRSIGLRLIANLTGADAAGRFDGIFDRYFDLLDDEKIVTARYLVQSTGKIVRHKPHLRERIIARLLGVDNTHHTESRKDLLKGDVIQAFEEFFKDSADQDSILAFAKAQLACSSPKTRKAAKQFLEKYGQ